MSFNPDLSWDAPAGCLQSGINMYWKNNGQLECGTYTYSCIQKNPVFLPLIKVTDGDPDMSVTEAEKVGDREIK